MPVDELVLVFDDIYVVVPTMRAEGVPFSDEALEALVDLDARLDAMSGQHHADLWRPAALAQDTRWVEVRDAAGRALRLLPSAP
jgi:hypothetical protein